MAYEILKRENIRTVQGVLFDLDGVILDTEKLYTRFWMEAAQASGFPMTLEQALGMRSLTRSHGREYLERCFGQAVDYTAVRNERIRRMDAWIAQHGVEEKPGIRTLLKFLHTHGIACAITTSSPRERIRKYLTPLGLYDQFDAICSGYEVPNGKPAPDIYLCGAESVHLAPESCLAVEDSPAGITSAFRAGCLPVIVPDQDEPDGETLAQCFARADSLGDLCPLLAQMNRL